MLGFSQGGMNTWLWGVTHPDAMDALVPMASLPTEMAGRNWMLRRLTIEATRRDPAYANGPHTQLPESLRTVSALYDTASIGGTLRCQAIAPTTAAADRLVQQNLAAPNATDAKDFVWQHDSSRDYNPGRCWTASRCPSSRSIPPMTDATRPKPV